MLRELIDSQKAAATKFVLRYTQSGSFTWTSDGYTWFKKLIIKNIPYFPPNAQEEFFPWVLELRNWCRCSTKIRPGFLPLRIIVRQHYLQHRLLIIFDKKFFRQPCRLIWREGFLWSPSHKKGSTRSSLFCCQEKKYIVWYRNCNSLKTEIIRYS